MKKNIKNYLLPIIFISFVIIFKLNPYSIRALAAKSAIRINGSAFNLIPFSTIREYIVNNNNYNTSIIIKFFILNLVVYMPLAVFLNKNKINNNTKLNYTVMFLTPIIIELLQAIFKVGLFDIDSVILNISGMLIIYKLFKNKRKSKY